MQNLIPALSHLKEAENAPQVSRRSSAFILSAPQVTAFPAGTRIDGVEAPTKLSKGIIIDKGIEYIAVLKEERQELQQRLAVAEQLISEVPNGRAVYESRLSQARSHPQSPNQTQTQSSPGGARSRTAMAVFGGIGLFGAGSTMSSFGSAVDPETSTSAWSGASHLAKRAANGLVESTPQGSNSWSTYIGWLAVLAWVIVLAHYLGSKLASCSVSEPVIVRPTRRDEALKALEQDALGYTPSSGPSQWHAQASVAKAQRARSALLTLSKASGYGSVASGTLGLMWQGFRSYLQKWMVPQSLDVADPDTAEHLTALVRLADVESAFGGC